jgi:hypothetical protein
MKLEEIVKNVQTNYESKSKQVEQLKNAFDKALVELHQLAGAVQLANEMFKLEQEESNKPTSAENTEVTKMKVVKNKEL